MATQVEPAPPRGERQQALVLVAAMVAVMWVLESVDQLADGRLDTYGVEPRDTDGLVGILTAPFLHVGFAHLVANTVPFVVLGAAIALSGLARVLAVTALVAVIGGLGTWLIAPADTEHLGASGLVFGYASYLIARGIFSRRLVHLAVGVVVAGVYGTTLLLGLLPEEGVSWQGHLFGAIGGVIAARLLDARPRGGSVATPESSLLAELDGG